MKKTNFFKLFLIGAMSLAIGFTSCQDSPTQKEFEELCERVDGMEADIDELRDLINGYHEGTTPPAGKYVTDVVLSEDGTKLLVSYTEGADREITLPVGGKIPYVVENEDGSYTLFVVLEGEEEFSEILIPVVTAGSNLTKIDILGWVEDYELGDLSVADLEVANHTAPVDPEAPLTGELYDGAEKTFVVYYNVIEGFSGDVNGASKPAIGTSAPNHDYPDGGAIYDGDTVANAKETQAAIDYFGVAKETIFTTLDAQNKGLIVQVHPSGEALTGIDFVLEDSKKNQLPVAFKEPVLVTGLLTRAAADSDLWFIEGADKYTIEGIAKDADFAKEFTPDALYTLVTPAGFRSEYTPFTFIPTLVKSLEGQVIEVGGEAIEPPVVNPTIAASYYVNVGTDYALGFDDVYFFNNAKVAVLDQARHDLEIDVTGGFVGATLPYTRETPLKNGVAPDPEVFTNSVIDYYMEIGSNLDDAFILTEFDITFGEDADGNMTFKIGQLPDDLTLATFFMDVYKLGVDGIVYYERVAIHPIRREIITEIDLGDYTVEDGFPGKTVNDYLGSALEYEESVNPGLIDLAPMFADLAKADYTDAQGATMEQRWKDEKYGAVSYVITNLSIDGHTEAENAGYGFLNRFMFPSYVDVKVGETEAQTAVVNTPALTLPVTGAIQNPELNYATYQNDTDDTDMFGQSPWQAGDMAAAWLALDANKEYIDGETNAGTSDYARFQLYDARFFQVFPNYAYNTGTSTNAIKIGDAVVAQNTNAPSFEIGKKHTFTIEFFDENKSLLNTLKISFTPVLPELNDLFVKEPEYWNADQTRLMAYYKTPDNWYNAKFYGIVTPDVSPFTIDTTFGSAAAAENMTFYNVYNPGGTTELDHTYNTPLDGGYTKIGLRNDTDKRWVATTTLALDVEKPAEYKIEGKVALGGDPTQNLFNILGPTFFGANKVNGIEGAQSVVYLYNQTNNYVADVTPGIPAPANLTGLPRDGEGVANAYGEVLPMKWTTSPYIDYYTIDATEKFEMQVLSALAEGKVTEVAGAIVGDAAPANGKFLALTDEHIKLENYNEQEFSVFKVLSAAVTQATPATGHYAYQYIYHVTFSRPAGVSVYDIMSPNTAVAGEWIQTNDEARAIAPSGTGDDAVASYVALRPNNLTGQANTKIHVKVYDRFGRTVEGDVNITLNVAGLEDAE
jgi:hypothetical protein